MKSWEQHYVEAEKAMERATDAGSAPLEKLELRAEAIAHYLAAWVGVNAVNSVADVRKSYENLMIGMVTTTVTQPIEEEKSE